MGGCFFPFSLPPTPPWPSPPLAARTPPPPFIPLRDHSSVSPACVCLSPNFIQRKRAGQMRRNPKKKSKTANKCAETNKQTLRNGIFLKVYLLFVTNVSTPLKKEVILVRSVLALPFRTDRSNASHLRRWCSLTDPRQRSSLSWSPAGKHKNEERSTLKQTREDTLLV